MQEATPDFVPRPRDESPIQVDRWPTEVPLLLVVSLFSFMLWALAVISIFGIIYAGMIATFFFLGHVVFVAHVRGNGVRLAPDQFPELHAAVERISQRMNLTPVPEAYLMQAGGALNAFASKFLRSNLVVLYSDLLDACGEDYAARDMIIGHELGHIKAGHLKWTWFLLPGSLLPFIGNALSRAREYTCDRYGLAAAGRRDSALLGLTILAAGGSHGPFVNREAMARQRQDLNKGWMRIGEWLTTHPPLVNRMAVLDPTLDAIAGSTTAGTVRGLGIIGAAVATPMVVTILAFSALMAMVATMGGANRLQSAQLQQADSEAALLAALGGGEQPRSLLTAAPAAEPEPEPQAPAQPVGDVATELATIQAKMDLETLASVIELEKISGSMPATGDALYAKLAVRKGQSDLRDPYDGQRYGFEPGEGYYVLRSAGPDKVRGTADDILKDSRLDAR